MTLAERGTGGIEATSPRGPPPLVWGDVVDPQPSEIPPAVCVSPPTGAPPRAQGPGAHRGSSPVLTVARLGQCQHHPPGWDHQALPPGRCPVRSASWPPGVRAGHPGRRSMPASRRVHCVPSRPAGPTSAPPIDGNGRGDREPWSQAERSIRDRGRRSWTGNRAVAAGQFSATPRADFTAPHEPRRS